MEEHIIIGSDRHITVPETLKKIAVQFDHNAETVTFDCPRYWDEHDLSKMAIYVNYMRPDETVGAHLCDNVVIDRADNDIMHFDWTISGHVTEIAGPLSFLVCIRDVDSEGNEKAHWNTELNTGMWISSGMRCRETILRKYPDIITQLLLRMDQSEAIVAAAKESASAAKTSEIAAKAAAEAAREVASEIAAGLPDWDQNDSTQPGYVKNRTHYVTKAHDFNFSGPYNWVEISSTDTYYAKGMRYRAILGLFEDELFSNGLVPLLCDISNLRGSSCTEVPSGVAQYKNGVQFLWAAVPAYSNYCEISLYSSSSASDIVPTMSNFKTLKQLSESYIPAAIARVVDVSTHIDTHNTSAEAHADIRELAENAIANGGDQVSGDYQLSGNVEITGGLDVNGANSTGVGIEDGMVSFTGTDSGKVYIGIDRILGDGEVYQNGCATLSIVTDGDEQVRIRGVMLPENLADAANKEYVDNAVANAGGGSGVAIGPDEPEEGDVWIDTDDESDDYETVDGELLIRDDPENSNSAVGISGTEITIYDDITNYDGVYMQGGYYGEDTANLGLYGSRGDEPVRFSNIADPVWDTDAANKQYVDSKIQYGTEDLTAGTSPLETGKLYIVYE